MAYYPETRDLVPAMHALEPQPYAHNVHPPNDYKTFTLLTAVICGVFSPLTLLLTIPAYISARKSQEAARKGDFKKAWERGLLAAYLNILAIVLALLVAALIMGLVLPFYRPEV